MVRNKDVETITKATSSRFPSLLSQSMFISCKNTIKARVNMIDHAQHIEI